MMKRTSGGQLTKTAYVRTQDLEKHITDLVKHHIKEGNMKTDAISINGFEGMIWIKIGVSFQ